MAIVRAHAHVHAHARSSKVGTASSKIVFRRGVLDSNCSTRACSTKQTNSFRHNQSSVSMIDHPSTDENEHNNDCPNPDPNFHTVFNDKKREKWRQQRRPDQHNLKQHPDHRLPSPLYVAATRQHVGKTTTCMALLSSLKKQSGCVGFMKPIGQERLEVPVTSTSGTSTRILKVDKDAVVVKEHFGLDHLSFNDNMSPLVIPN